MKIHKRTPAVFTEYFEKGDSALAFPDDVKVMVKSEFEWFLSDIIDKGLDEEQVNDIPITSYNRDQIFENYAELMKQTLSERSEAMFDLKLLAKNDYVEFDRRCILQEFTKLEEVILHVAIINNLELGDIQTLLKQLANVHEALRPTWDQNFFIETYKFECPTNLKTPKVLGYPKGAFIKNVEAEYLNMCQFVKIRKWKLPEGGYNSRKDNDQGKKRRKVNDLLKKERKFPKRDHLLIKCHNCGQNGHFARCCKSPKKQDLNLNKNCQHSETRSIMGFTKNPMNTDWDIFIQRISLETKKCL